MFSCETKICIRYMYPCDTTIKFHWEYSTKNSSLLFDPFGYSINDNFTQLTKNNTTNNQNGDVFITVSCDVKFCLV